MTKKMFLACVAEMIVKHFTKVLAYS